MHKWNIQVQKYYYRKLRMSSQKEWVINKSNNMKDKQDGIKMIMKDYIVLAHCYRR